MSAFGVGAALVMAPRAVAAQFPAELAGQVVDERTATPVPNARVLVPATGLAVETDAAGRFRLKGLPAGECEIEVVSIGYHGTRLRVTLTDGRVERTTVRLAPMPVALAPIEVTGARVPPGPGVSVVNREQIEATVAPDVPALLAGQPGVTITREGGAGSPASISIRGSAPHQVLVLVDDVPLNDPTTGDVDLSTIPLEQIERITIVRGAAAARYGPRALAGAVAIERRRATRTEGRLTLGAGGWGERTARGSASVVRESGERTLAGSLTGGLTRFAGDFGYEVPPIRGGGTADRANADGRNTSLLGSLRVGGGRSLVEARGDYLDSDRGMPGSVVQPTPTARQTERRLGAGLGTRQVTGTVEWRADVDANEGKVHYGDPAPPAAAPYDDSVRVRQLQARLDAARTFGAARLTLGTEARWLGVRASYLTEGAPDEERVLSGWLQASAEPRLAATTATVSAGARLDNDDHRDETILSPSLAVSVPVPGVTLQLSWGMAYAPPTLADQFFQPGVLARPNPDLGAERVRNDWQAQVTSNTIRLGGGVTASGSLALFHADVDGMILWFPDFQFIWSPDNYDVTRRGAELGVTLGIPLADLSLSGSVSDAAVEYRGPVLSGQVAYRPRHTANASLSGTALGLRASARYRYIGLRRTIPGSDLNTLPPFSVVDLQVTRPLPVAGADLEVGIGVDDLFDKAGTMLIDYPSPGRTWRLAITARGPGARVSDTPPSP